MYEIVTLRTQGALGSLVMTLHNISTTTEIKTPTKNANYKSNNNTSASDNVISFSGEFCLFVCFLLLSEFLNIVAKLNFTY